MKTQLRKPARDRARYSEEYKKEALELWRNSGRSAAKVAAELGIRAPLLYRWAQLERSSKVARSEPKSKRSVEVLEAEIRRLCAENTKLLEQRKEGRQEVRGEEGETEEVTLATFSFVFEKREPQRPYHLLETGHASRCVVRGEWKASGKTNSD